MNHDEQAMTDDIVEGVNLDGASRIVLVCEHASAAIPDVFDSLGLSGDALTSHAAWDPGAMALATALSQHLDAPLIASRISRLVYDCNRPPSAQDAMPARSEIFDIPGNADLSQAARAQRTATYYTPFRATLAKVIAEKSDPILVTIHSFTPVYHGKHRAVEIGVLHDTDARLADAMLQIAPAHSPHIVQRNEPYGPQDGVTHTLQEHGIKSGHPNVMIEVRNDLIQTDAAQRTLAEQLAGWLMQAIGQMHGDTTCKD